MEDICQMNILEKIFLTFLNKKSETLIEVLVVSNLFVKASVNTRFSISYSVLLFHSGEDMICLLRQLHTRRPHTAPGGCYNLHLHLITFKSKPESLG